MRFVSPLLLLLIIVNLVLVISNERDSRQAQKTMTRIVQDLSLKVVQRSVEAADYSTMIDGVKAGEHVPQFYAAIDQENDALFANIKRGTEIRLYGICGKVWDVRKDTVYHLRWSVWGKTEADAVDLVIASPIKKDVDFTACA